MIKKSGIRSALILFLCLSFVVALPSSCEIENNKIPEQEEFQYRQFRDSLLAEIRFLPVDSSNFFDNGNFTPSKDSLEVLLAIVDTMLSQLEKIEELSPAEKSVIAENMQMLNSFYRSKVSISKENCLAEECFLFVHVVKSKQLLYLYVGGNLEDSFPVSTGMKKYTTPDMDRHPSGPLFKKYTSRKFPGGNYKGLGNMPYAVFIKGGYAIHGTTPGNFSKLGQIASHGCVRLHPDNARLLYELVKLNGLENTWVRITDSIQGPDQLMNQEPIE